MDTTPFDDPVPHIVTVQMTEPEQKREDRSGSFFRELEVGGEIIRIKQLYVGDVGCVVWDAAIVLCKFLENENYFPSVEPDDKHEVDSHSQSQISTLETTYWTGKRVIDLGSGTGVVGIAAGVLG